HGAFLRFSSVAAEVLTGRDRHSTLNCSWPWCPLSWFFSVRKKRLVLSRFILRFLIQKDSVAIQVFQHDSRAVWPHLRVALKLHAQRLKALVVAQAIVGGYAKKRKTAALLADESHVAVALGHVQGKHRLVTVRPF